MGIRIEEMNGHDYQTFVHNARIERLWHMVWREGKGMEGNVIKLDDR